MLRPAAARAIVNLTLAARPRQLWRRQNVNHGESGSGQISALYRFIRPAVDQAHGDFEAAIKANAQIQAKLLTDSSPVVASAVKDGKLKVVSAYYGLASGKVVLLDS